jgi:hypothetical protein
MPPGRGAHACRRAAGVCDRDELESNRLELAGRRRQLSHALIDCYSTRGDVLTELRQSTGPLGSDTVDPLILDLLEWIGPNPRPYAEVLEAWRTSCPRLAMWVGRRQ